MSSERGTRSARRLRLSAWLPLFLFALSCSARPGVDDDRLIKDLDSPHWQIRASAADELGRRGVERAAARLGAALGDDADEVRGAAVNSLGLLGAKSELDKIRHLLDTEDDRQVKVLALYALANLAAGEKGDKLRDDAARVEGKLDDDSRRVKRAAARVLRMLVGPSKAEPEKKRTTPRAKPSEDDPGQNKWGFDRIDDRIALARDGECTLTRTIVVRGLRSTPATRIDLYLPPTFTQVNRVVDASGGSLAFEFKRKGDERLVWFAVPPLGKGETATFTLSGRSRRPVFIASADEALFVYSPAPADAPVAALRVEVSFPAGGTRAIEPADLQFRSEATGEVATLDRTGLSRSKLKAVVLRIGIPASSLTLPRTPPRYYTEGSDLALAAAVVAAALAILAACILWLRRKLGEASHRAILVAVLTTGAFLFLTPILVEDNFTYYASARSAVFDGDLDRVNEYSEMNQTQAYDPDHRGPLDPAFTPFFETPFLAAAHGLTLAINAVTPAHAPNGFAFPYLFLVAVGDFLAVLFGCLACFALVERRVGRPYALFAVLAVVAGTNLQLFAYAWTGSSFQPSFFLFAIFLDHWDRTRDNRTGFGWLASGVLLGLLGATRTLNLGFVVLPLLDWIHTAVTRSAKDGKPALMRHVGHGALFTAGILLALVPQLMLQRLVDQTWFVDAYGVGTGRFSGFLEHLPSLLFAREPDRSDGLLATMPMLALALAGLVPLFRSDRRLGAMVTATLAVQFFAIASYEIYWGYFWYGTPYFVPSSPIFCLGLASLLKAVHKRWPRRGLAVLACVAVPFALRTGWCTLRQLGFNQTGEPTSSGKTLDVLHAMLMPGRKLDVDLLRNSSEFGCLLRETVGALRARDFGQFTGAMFWVALLVAITVLAYGVATRSGRLASRIPPRTLRRFAIPVLALMWIAIVGWLASLGANTDLDYRYESEVKSAGKREYRITRLEPGQTYDVSMELEYAAAINVITFLDDAVSVTQGTRVGTIEVEGSGKRVSYDLRAGIDTADFSIDRPESKSGRAHTAPLDKACFSWRVDDDSSHYYTARAYRSEFRLPALDKDFEVNVTSTLEHGVLAVVVVTAIEQKLPRDPSRQRWLADRW